MIYISIPNINRFFNLQAVSKNAHDCIRLLLEANAIIDGKTIKCCNDSYISDTLKKMISDEMINRVSNLDILNAV